MEKKSSTNYIQVILVVLLIVSAYLIGSLTTKVSYLQNGGSAVANAGAPAAAGAAPNAAPPAPEVKYENVALVTDRDYVKGNKNADIVLMEYSDLECPFCKQFHPTLEKAMTEYGDKVQWVWRHFPLSFHVNAQKESEAAECAGELGGSEAYWKYIDTVIERTTSNGTGFALDKLVPLAVELGLPEAKFKSCLDGGKYTQFVTDSIAAGQKAGVTGTPGTILINTKTKKVSLVPGALPYEQLKPMIDALL